MSKFVKCGKCGTVYDMYGTHGTTVINGYCPMCGLHHSGTHSIAYPVLKPSPLAAQPIDVSERTCTLIRHEVKLPDSLKEKGVEMNVYECSECGEKMFSDYNYCPNCGAKVVE